MRAHARPWPILGASDQSRTHRMEAHIPYGRDQMRIVHHHRAEAALKEMPAPAPPPVDEVGITAVGFAEGSREAGLVAGHEDQMDVIWHEAVGPNLDLRLCRLL